MEMAGGKITTTTTTITNISTKEEESETIQKVEVRQMDFKAQERESAFLDQEVKARERESALLDADEAFAKWKKKEMLRFESILQTETNKWERTKKNLLSLQTASLVKETRKKKEKEITAVAMGKRKNPIFYSFRLPMKIVLDQDTSLEDIRKILQGNWDQEIDLSKIRTKDWIDILRSGSQVKCVSIRDQNLNTDAKIQILVSFIENSPKLIDLHLESNQLTWESLFPFFNLWYSNSRRKLILKATTQQPFRLHLSGNPVTLGKPWTFLAVKSCIEEKNERDVSFEFLQEQVIYFANKYSAKLDENKNLWLPDRFSAHKKSPYCMRESRVIPVLKISGLLYIASNLPWDLHLYPGETPDIELAPYVQVANPYPQEHLITKVHELKIGQSGYLTNLGLEKEENGTTQVICQKSPQLVQGTFVIPFDAMLVQTQMFATKQVKITRNENLLFTAVMPLRVYKDYMPHGKKTIEQPLYLWKYCILSEIIIS